MKKFELSMATALMELEVMEYSNGKKRAAIAGEAGREHKVTGTVGQLNIVLLGIIFGRVR